MVARLTAREVAKKLGITEGAVSLASKRGRIVKDRDGLINPKHPVNEIYLKGGPRQRRHPSVKPGAKRAQKPRRSAKAPDYSGDFEAGEESGGSLAQEKAEQELRKLTAQAEKEELGNSIKRGTLIERNAVHRFLSRLYVIDTSELRPLGDRLASTLVGMVRSTDSDEVATTRVNERLTEEVFRSLQHIQTLLDQFIAEGMPDTEDEADAED